MFFRNSSRKKLLKQVSASIHLAKKVIAYRKDILAPSEVELIEILRIELVGIRKNKNSTNKNLEQVNGELKKVLKCHGGTIYPITFS